MLQEKSRSLGCSTSGQGCLWLLLTRCAQCCCRRRSGENATRAARWQSSGGKKAQPSDLDPVSTRICQILHYWTLVANDMPPRSVYGAGRNLKAGSRARILAALDSRQVVKAACGYSSRAVLNVGAAGRPERSRHEPPNGRVREAHRHHPEEARICCRRNLAALDSRQVVKAACGYSSRAVLNVGAAEGPERTRHEPPSGRVREAEARAEAVCLETNS